METSVELQTTSRPASIVETIPLIQYVNGETRYMNSQNPGRLPGVCRTPLKRMDMRVNSETNPEAVSAFGKAAMVMAAKDDV